MGVESGFKHQLCTSLRLNLRLTVVCSGRINTVLIGDDFPELGTDLVAALAALDVDDFTHGGGLL